VLAGGARSRVPTRSMRRHCWRCTSATGLPSLRR
jgi:hypothetical protein